MKSLLYLMAAVSLAVLVSAEEPDKVVVSAVIESCSG